MPHYRCVPCQTRLHDRGAPRPDGPLCPDCGSPLEPVSALTQLVGLQSVTPDVGADRWLDDDGGLLAEAIAVALPHPPAER